MSVLLDGSAWFVLAIVVAAVVTAATKPDRRRAPSRFYGVVIGVMGTGHLVAVTYLDSPRWFLYALGITIAASGCTLAIAASRVSLRRLVWLNVAPGAIMIAGIASAALAIPAALNLLDLRGSRRGFAIATGVVYAAMFVAAVVLLSV